MESVLVPNPGARRLMRFAFLLHLAMCLLGHALELALAPKPELVIAIVRPCFPNGALRRGVFFQDRIRAQPDFPMDISAIESRAEHAA